MTDNSCILCVCVHCQISSSTLQRWWNDYCLSRCLYIINVYNNILSLCIGKSKFLSVGQILESKSKLASQWRAQNKRYINIISTKETTNTLCKYHSLLQKPTFKIGKSSLQVHQTFSCISFSDILFFRSCISISL